MISAYQIAKFVKGEIIGENFSVEGAIDLIPGKKTCISFLGNNLSNDYLDKTKSNLIVISNSIPIPDSNKTFIRVLDPKKSFFNIVDKYFHQRCYNSFNDDIHQTATISKLAKISSTVSIGPNTIISDDVEIEDNVKIGGNCFIGKGTMICKGSLIHPNTTIYNNILIKNNVVINSGTIIGAYGFGIIKDGDELIQVPHIGTIEIEENVIIGSGCTIDRATMSKTLIGKGTKIDGQVHIAHNVEIGKNCIIAGQVAIGGSSKLGDNVTLGGQVGVIDNLVIGNNCVVGAKSAVMKSLDDDSVVSGIPAINHLKKLRLDVLHSRLPELFKKNK